MSLKWVFASVAVLALAAGTALWLGMRGPASPPASGTDAITPGALYAAAFADLQGRPQALGQYQGRLVVLNFWATWCGPCREEMPAFNRLQNRWAAGGVQFVGVSNEDPQRVKRFASDLGIAYPLWVGGDEVGELSRRLGNTRGVLPHTALLGPGGEVLESKVGAYSEVELERMLAKYAPKGS